MIETDELRAMYGRCSSDVMSFTAKARSAIQDNNPAQAREYLKQARLIVDNYFVILQQEGGNLRMVSGLLKHINRMGEAA